jgi:hypothetical protein
VYSVEKLGVSASGFEFGDHLPVQSSEITLAQQIPKNRALRAVVILKIHLNMWEWSFSTE